MKLIDLYVSTTEKIFIRENGKVEELIAIGKSNMHRVIKNLRIENFPMYGNVLVVELKNNIKKIDL